jgi:diguanylate cyclase (GGDEF)-like protein
MELLHKAGLKIVSNIDLDMLLSTIVNLVSVNLGYDNCAIFLPIDNRLVLKAQSHFPEKVLGLEIKIGNGTVGRCAQDKEVINIGDVPGCDFYIPSGLKGIQSAIALPILYENRLLGVLATESQKKNTYQEEDVRVLNVLCSQMGVALRNAQMLAQLEKLAITDGLTGLYNYRYFSKRLEQETERARRYKRDLSLVLIDLDNFKMVNDIFGHTKGDEVLVEISQIIIDNVRKTDHSSIMKEVAIDIPVRYGGEELMILLPETHLEGAINAAQRLNMLIKERVNIKVPLIKDDGEQLFVTGSFGVASLRPDEKAEDLIKRVDQAMYESKNKGKDQVHWTE